MTTEPELHEMLPWSHPFLMVDQLVRFVPHELAVTRKRVTSCDSVIPESASGEAFFPTVLILEGLNQSAALLFRLSYGPKALSSAPLLGFLSARIRGNARPGDTLEYTVTAIKMTSRAGVFAGVARVDATVVASTELAFGVGAP